MIYQEAGYQPINTGSIADLLRQSGQISSDKLQALANIAAQSQTTQGNASAGFAQNLGNIMSNAVMQYGTYGGGNKSFEPGGKDFSGPMQNGPVYRVDPSIATMPGGGRFMGPQQPVSPSLMQQQQQAILAAQRQQAAVDNWKRYFAQPESVLATQAPTGTPSREEALRAYSQWVTGNK